MEIIKRNHYMHSVHIEVESIIDKSRKDNTHSNALIIQSLNGINVKTTKRLANNKALQIILTDLQILHQKKEISLIINDQHMIKEKYNKGEINLIFLITLPQIDFKNDNAFKWVFHDSLKTVTLLKNSAFKIDDLLFYVIDL